MSRLLLTGAGGFVGTRLVSALLARPEFRDWQFIINDLVLNLVHEDARVSAVAGDFGAAATRDALLHGGANIVIHLAGILGGAAEADYDLSRQVNVEATLSLIEAIRDAAAPIRLVFASSIAVFGPPLDRPVDDDTMPMPLMNYGAQKRMIEIAIEQFSARGWIDGIALRLPGVVARPGADARLKSAFLNRLFFAFAAGEDIVLPVSAGGTTWLISVDACVDALIHAALLPPEKLGRRRAFTLPAQCLSFGALVDALSSHFPDSRTRVTFDPDPAIEAQFGSQPPLLTPLADALRFRHDGSIASLIARALA